MLFQTEKKLCRYLKMSELQTQKEKKEYGK